MKLFKALFKFFFSIICIIGAIGFAKAGITTFENQDSSDLLFLAIGAALFLLIWFIFLSQRESFWGLVEHEFTHAFFALLFFKKVRTINADRRRGGLVKVEGGNFVIALAPYFFPLLSVFIILIKPLVFGNYQWFLNALLGFTLMFHLMSLSREFHPSQPDLKETGFLFSLTVIIFFNLFFIGLSIASLSGQWQALGAFIRSGLQESLALLSHAWHFVNMKIPSDII